MKISAVRRAAPGLVWLVWAACGGGPEPAVTTSLAGPTGPAEDSSAPTDDGGAEDDEASGDSGSEGGQAGCDGSKLVVSPKQPSAECVPGVPCVTDANCPDGHTCNMALEPPGCALLYCGEAGTPCADDTVCSQGLQCHQGLCNPCTFCGDLCEVDLSSDPAHCGCCDRPVSDDTVCVDGAIVCAQGLTMCGSECVDTYNDPQHCGGCDQPVEAGMDCADGVSSCGSKYDALELCDGKCVDTDSDKYHCGACGRTCPYGECVDAGLCRLEVDKPSSLPMTCNYMCTQAGLTCAAGKSTVGGASYKGTCGTGQDASDECHDTPLAEWEDGICGSDCTCGVVSQYCYCEATPG